MASTAASAFTADIRWLRDHPEPSVRYLTRRDLLGIPAGDSEMKQTRYNAHASRPIAAILDAMHPEGFWVKPGAGYYPKYTGTVWSLINLAQLGASIADDERIARACDYYLECALVPGGQVTFNGTPSSTADCLQGNMCAALVDLGVPPERLTRAFDWMARTVTGEGIASIKERGAELRYYAGKCGPFFACGSNDSQACAWGGAKVMLAFGKLPQERRTPQIERAMHAGAEFFLSADLLKANFPHPYAPKPSGNWWKLGFPVFYVSDLLQIIEALSLLGYGCDPRLAGVVKWVIDRADASGRWILEYDYNGKTWVDYGAKKQPNPWVTLRALTALRHAGVPLSLSAG